MEAEREVPGMDVISLCAKLGGVLTLAGAVALCFYLREKLRAYSVKAAIMKSVVSLLFVATAVCCAWSVTDPARPRMMALLVILGLVCGLAGDIWLDLKYAYREEETRFTYAGFFSFAAGHMCYILGLLACTYLLPDYCDPVPGAYVWIPLALGTALGFGNMLLEKPMKLRYGRYKPICILYGALLFSTVLLSGSLALYYRWQYTTLNLFFAGAALFAASDLVLSGTYFGEGKDRPVDIILNYLTYYPGQFLIAWSLLFLYQAH